MRNKYMQIFIISLFLHTFITAAGATDLIVNDGFMGGLGNWVVNPQLPVSGNWPWSSQTGAVNLHPSVEGFTGTIIYQNMNASGIGSNTIHFQMKLSKNFAPDGSTVAVYLTYVDTSNALKRVQILNPVNASVPQDPGDPTATKQTDYTFPASARKLVKVEIAKENYGDFIVDDIVLSTDASVTSGSLPVISGISHTSGAYGAGLTISGSGFGAQQGVVFVGGGFQGVSIDTWTDSSIGLTIREPGRSGPVKVVIDYVESNQDYMFNVTSPNFTVDVLNPAVKVIKGQTATVLVKVDFFNGFTTENGIAFIPPGIPATVTFTPDLMKSSGGVLVKIDTGNLAPGVYNLNIQSAEDASYARFSPFTLNVVTVADVRFFETQGSPPQKTYITTKALSQQGQFGTNQASQPGQPFVSYEVTDSDGALLGNDLIALRSDNPSILGAYPRYWGYDLYALGNGTANLIPVAPDGADIADKKLPVTITIPPEVPQFTSVTLTPNPVSNKGTQDITFYAGSTAYINGIGMDTSGLMNFQTDAITNPVYSNCDDPFYQSTCKSIQSVFRMTNPPSDLGTAVIYASSGNSPSSAIVALPLTTVNDPSYSGLKCAIKALDVSLPVQMDMFNLEFYRSGDITPFFTKLVWSMGAATGKLIDVGGIQPGTYKVRFVPQQQTIQSQFYPNTTDIGLAELVQFSAGQSPEIYFFARPAPTISFTGSVKDAINNYPNTPVGGATIGIVNNPTLGTVESDAGGTFTIPGIAQGTDFSLQINKAGYLPLYSANYNSAVDINALLPFGLFPGSAFDTNWSINPGNGVILGKVKPLMNPTAGNIAGANITAVNFTTRDPLQVTYQNANGTFGGSSTSTNGFYYIFNVPDGVTVEVSVSKAGWNFPIHKVWLTAHAGAISEESFFGTFSGGDINGDNFVNLADLLLALQILTGITPVQAVAIADVNGDGQIGLAEAIYILQMVAGMR